MLKKEVRPTKEEAKAELFELELCFWLVMLVRGALFLAKEAMTFPTFSDDDACRLARNDVVDEENDDRRLPFCVDIFLSFLLSERESVAKKFGCGLYSKMFPFTKFYIFITLQRKFEGLNWRKILAVDSTRQSLGA